MELVNYVVGRGSSFFTGGGCFLPFWATDYSLKRTPVDSRRQYATGPLECALFGICDLRQVCRVTPLRLQV